MEVATWMYVVLFNHTVIGVSNLLSFLNFVVFSMSLGFTLLWKRTPKCANN